MQKKNYKAKDERNAEGFGGVGADRDHPATESGECLALVNLRANADGTLTSRKGYAYCGSFPRSVRFVTADRRGTNGGVIALCGNEIFSLRLDGTPPNSVATVGSDEGDGALFFAGGSLFAADGGDILRIGENGETAENGYAPLYGKDWHPTLRGDIRQKKNVLSDRLRISFKTKGTDGDSERFDFGLEVLSVDRVTLNGEELPDPSKTLASDKTGATLPSSPVGSKAEFWLSVNRDDSRYGAAQFSKAALFGSSRIVLYGGDLARVSLPISESDGRAEPYADAHDLYVPEGNVIRLGSARRPESILPLGEHGLILTRDSLHLMDWGGGADKPTRALPTVRTLSDAVGTDGACSTCGDDVITLSGGKLYRVFADGGHEVREIGEGVSSLIEEISPSAAFDNKTENEVWLYSPEARHGKVLVYNYSSEKFYVFSGIYADAFFIADGNLGFLSGNDAFVFKSDAVDSDVDATHEIEIRAASQNADFALPDEYKRACRAVVRAIGETGGVSAVLSLDNGAKARTKLRNGATTLRISRGKFKLATWEIRGNCKGDIRLCGVELYAN